MSLQDDYFDLCEWMKDKPEEMRKSFDNIWCYSIHAEVAIETLTEENEALKKVIEIKTKGR